MRERGVKPMFAACPQALFRPDFTGWVGLGAPTPLERETGLWVSKADARRFPQGFAYHPRRDPHWEWGAVLEGGLALEQEERRLRVGAGCYYLMPPGRALIARAADNPLVLWVEWQGAAADGFARLLGGGPDGVIVAHAHENQLACAARIARSLHERPNDFALVAQAALWDLLVHTRAPTVFARAQDDDIRRVLAYLEGEGAAAQPTLQQLSALARLPVETFRKRFAQQVGCPPIQYALRAKTRRAKALLAEPGLNVNQVCAACGFADPYYFSRLFKKIEGVSPLQFRKLAQREGE